jgi:cytochrome c oxidase subunit 2
MAFYVIVYTMWLKRRTSLNIVIGGAAGAAPPLIGWAAGANELSLVPVIMFLVVFLWTPPHFWALAIYLKEEYARAGVPMLPVVTGDRVTCKHIAAYTALLLPMTAWLGIRADLGWVFSIGSTLLGMGLIRRVVQLWRRKDRHSAQELFHYSVVYLALVFALLSASALFSDCWAAERPHSILDPAGPHAERIATLWWQMFGVYGVVFVVTLLFVVAALTARRQERPVLGSRFVFISGIAVPALILFAMLIYTIRITVELTEGPGDFRVQVAGRHWWFEVRYPEHGIVDANEIHVPAGSLVGYELTSGGVVHSFWIPRLGGKRDLLPDHPTELLLKADRPGVYHGTCTEYCGGPHALMAFQQVVHTPEDFQEWLHRVKTPRPEPTDSRLVRGREVFMEAGCAGCHSINGLSRASAGPDLTLVGSRRTLGAGQLPNTRANLSGWIANSQALKPRNMMPRFYLPPEELHDLVDYLGSLP